MVRRRVVLATSALPTSVKTSILMEEGSRRLKCCTPQLPWADKVGFLNKFSCDMKNSGHSASYRRNILKRVILRYEMSLSNHLEGTKHMYRTRQEREMQKKVGPNLNTRDMWFRKDGSTSILTVPPTPNGELVQLVRKNLQKSRQPAGTKIKVVEGNGSKTGHLLVRTNQFPRETCHREKCVLCVQGGSPGKKTKCDISNVGYEGKCVRCVETPHIYVGETSRTGFTRVSQPLTDFRAAATAKLPPLPDQNCLKRPPKSWILEHV